ncbi:MAG TPA: class I SAM-dependent methyltransferase [Natronosporangium sp.]
MGVPEPVQATAYLAAACRAAETRSANPRLRDPYAERFAAAGRGSPPYQRLLAAGGDEVVARTALLDQLVLAAVADGEPPLLLNLGAGCCTRPYRLDLSGCALVVEWDDPAVLAVKQRALADARPSCPVQRAGADLRDPARLRELLAALPPVPRVVVVTEGLLPYLSPAAIAELAGELGRALPGARWLTDLVSSVSAEGMAQLARAAGVPVELSGLDTLAPFEQHGWVAVDYRLLPTPRRGPLPRPSPAGAASHRVVDGVAAFARQRVPAAPDPPAATC